MLIDFIFSSKYFKIFFILYL